MIILVGPAAIAKLATGPLLCFLVDIYEKFTTKKGCRGS